jgi:predicted Co/Zn/Cd cation transporter (cation efflux family)
VRKAVYNTLILYVVAVAFVTAVPRVQNTQRVLEHYKGSLLHYFTLEGARLIFIANTSVIQPVHSIWIKLEVNNTLNTPLSYTIAENAQIFSWSMTTCAHLTLLLYVGLRMYQGFATPRNITKAKPLELAPPIVLSCIVGWVARHVVLLLCSD